MFALLDLTGLHVWPVSYKYNDRHGTNLTVILSEPHTAELNSGHIMLYVVYILLYIYIL